MMDCAYRHTDGIIVDYVIDGVRDKKLQGRLLEKGEVLTLAQAIEIGQHFELSQKQLGIARDESEVDVTVVWRKKQHVCMKKNPQEPCVADEETEEVKTKQKMQGKRT